jgi:hypothetical protein
LGSSLADGQAELGGAGVLVDPDQQRGPDRGEVVQVIDGEVDLAVAGAGRLVVPAASASGAPA